MTYILDVDGKPLMPTNRNGKVRRMLKNGQAKVVKSCPFTIQLTYEPKTKITQDITLGVDAGSKFVGLSASTKDKELYCAEVILRQDIVDLLASRREARRTRRGRKTRYRPARFLNRKKSKHKGWLAPSVINKIQTHETAIANVHKILPVKSVVVETASFDMQRIKAKEEGKPIPYGDEYKYGEQYGFYNTREYVLWRDGYECQCCHGKSQDKYLRTHHIESRKTGGNAPNNLITICNTCHKKYHNPNNHEPMIENFRKTIKRGKSYKDATFMGIMRKTLLNKLKDKYDDVTETFGYITKGVRIKNGLQKDHAIDALCIANHAEAKPMDEMYLIKKVRCHNRQIHRAKPSKGGKRYRAQSEYKVNGFRLNDVVRFEGQEGFVGSRNSDGQLKIKKLDGTLIRKSVTHKKVQFVRTSNSHLIEKQERIVKKLSEITEKHEKEQVGLAAD